MQRRNKPEVLAPAGNLRGLKTAVDYGADAVYCGGKAFGMRSAPKNLSLEDFEEGSRYAHERGARVYVTFNVLPRNNEVEAMREYLGKLKDTGVDALIVSDIGVMLMAKQVAPNLELHVSTQAGVTNYQAANAFYELGARRVVLAGRRLTEIICKACSAPDVTSTWLAVQSTPVARICAAMASRSSGRPSGGG